MLANALRETRASWAFVERQLNLIKRYAAWEGVFLFYAVINSLTIGLIAVGMTQGQPDNTHDMVLFLLVGSLLWNFLSVIFQEVGHAISYERWEGTIEYTFMAPIRRFTHLGGICLFAVLFGLMKTTIILLAVSAFFGVIVAPEQLPQALVVLVVSTLPFMGIGLMAAVLPLLSPERGTQAVHIVEGMLLLVSGVYYSVDILPEWLKPLSALSPATYTLEGVRGALLHGWGWAELMPIIAKLALMGVVLVPMGFMVFAWAERLALTKGLLKRNG